MIRRACDRIDAQPDPRPVLGSSPRMTDSVWT